MPVTVNIKTYLREPMSLMWLACPILRLSYLKNRQFRTDICDTSNNGYLDLCKRLATSRSLELHELELPFVSPIEIVRAKLSISSDHVTEANDDCRSAGVAAWHVPFNVKRSCKSRRCTKYLKSTSLGPWPNKLFANSLQTAAVVECLRSERAWPFPTEYRRICHRAVWSLQG